MTFLNGLVTAGLVFGVVGPVWAAPVGTQRETAAASRVVVVPSRVEGTTTAPVQALPPLPEQGSIYQDVTVAGLPVHTRAPVLAPYDGSAYRIYGGQPETGGDALLAASLEGR
jgi:hypothetical protein